MKFGLPEKVSVLGLDAAARRGRPLLEPADQLVIDLAHEQLAHRPPPQKVLSI